eukprot:698036-Prymnesium_polylepis.1
MGEAGKRLAEEVKAAMAEGLQIKMAHENDEDRSGCAFSTFFETVTVLQCKRPSKPSCPALLAAASTPASN